MISETDIDVIQQLREEVELAQHHKDECQSKMDSICQQYFPDQLQNLQTIPGIKGRSATAIIAEVGSEVSSFEDAAHLVCWAGLKPRNEESAGKIKARSITHGVILNIDSLITTTEHIYVLWSIRVKPHGTLAIFRPENCRFSGRFIGFKDNYYAQMTATTLTLEGSLHNIKFNSTVHCPCLRI